MYRIVETFSGIGSQVQALKNIKMEHEIITTVEWDINSICAYDVLHNSDFDTSVYDHVTKKDLVKKLSTFTLSSDGKKPLTRSSLSHMSEYALKRILLSIERNNNLVSIKDVKGENFPEDIDILTYSFPCQDLSICGYWHGNTSGIDRCAMNRSGLLWEIERILFEMGELNTSLPKVLLMENVSNILSEKHKKNFNEWKDYLSSVGYFNHVYTLSAINFGIPQTRERVFMISIQCEKEDHGKLETYFKEHNLENQDYIVQFVENKSLSDFLRMDYSIEKYRLEANESQPNFTPSRKKIYLESKIIADGKQALQDTVTTITTKQDRYPNSGLVKHDPCEPGKAPYRNLTGRECIMLMGFEEEQFEKLVMYNFNLNSKRKMFVNSKYIKMAGNSIVVQVLEQIFRQIMEIDEILKNNEESLDIMMECVI